MAASVVAIGLALPTPPQARPLRKPVPAAAPADLRPGDARVPVVQTGRVSRRLDPSGAVPGHIDISYELHLQRDATRANQGTIVASEGGPGYATTGSRASYLALFGELLDTRHLLLVNNRGTGGSAALRCPALQGDPATSEASVLACAERLGERAALYGSALAADDLAAVLDTLAIGRVDLYGDSYGSFFAQAFAGRHPGRLRSLVLDGAYAVTGADPWYPEAALQARAAFDAACERSPGCAVVGGPSSLRLQALLQRVRVAPFTGMAPDGDGQLQVATADARGLAYVMFSNASGPVVYRELDAAARALEQQGDTAPLLRLVAENQTAAVSAGAVGPYAAYSAGLFVAVSCADYPQIYRMTDPPDARREQAARAIAAKRQSEPDVYAPFTIDEFLSLPQDYSLLALCIPWPVPPAAHPPGQPVPPGAPFPNVPVLVLSGEFDSLTPPAQGAQAAALFPNARQVVLNNSFHVTALGDADGCASGLVRRFITTLDAGDAACAATVPAWHTVPAFVRQSADLATPQAGRRNQASPVELRRAAAAVMAAGDALARWWVNYDGQGVGLRGGRFAWRTQGRLTQLELQAMRWTDDVPASGRVAWSATTQQVRARLTLPGGTLQAEWTARGGGEARLTGHIGGRRIVATMPAP